MSNVDFTTYQKPGVYVSEVDGPYSSARTTEGTVLAIVGLARGYRTVTEQVALTGITNYDLLNAGVKATGISVVGRENGVTYAANTDYTVTINQNTGVGTIVRVRTPVVNEDITLSGTTAKAVANPSYIDSGTVTVKSTDGQTTYAATTDYVIDYDNGTIVRTADSTIPDNVEIHISYSYCAMKSGSYFNITYNYADDAYYEPIRFEDYEDVVGVYGAPFDSTGAIDSPLSLAMFFAFRNGAKIVYGVAVNNADVSDPINVTTAEFTAALETLDMVDNIDIICIASGVADDHNAVESYVASRVANQQECRTIVGADGSSTLVSSASMVTRATGFANERVMLVSPSTVKFFNPYTNTIDVLPGFYLAAAVAGVACAVNPYDPLTLRGVYGFYAHNEIRKRSEKLNEARSGLCYIDSVNDRLRVFHGRTTDVDTLASSEWSVSFSKDKLMQFMRTFYDGVIGKPITENTPYIVKSMTISALEILKAAGYVVDYGEPKVRQNAVTPTMIDVKFGYDPPYPCNYINIQFSISAESGAIG